MEGWRGRAGWVALVVAVLAGAGVAAARPGSAPRADTSAALAAAGVGDGAALADRTTTTVPGTGPATTRTPAPPTTMPPTTMPPTPTTTRTTPTTRPGAAPTTARSSPPQTGFTPTTVGPGQTPPTVPAPVNPPAWTFEKDGVFSRVRMAPTTPRIGDTVEFTIESWTDLAGVTCCSVSLWYGESVFLRSPGPGPCPAPPPRVDRVSYRISQPMVSPIPGPFVTVEFLLSVYTTFDPCAPVQPASTGGAFGLHVVLRLPGA